MATVAMTAPNTSINKIAGRATRAIRWPVEGDASTNCEAIKSAMADMGVIAQPTHSACSQLDPLPEATQYKAIQTLGYIPITQFHLVAKKPFWESDGLSPSMWTDVGATTTMTSRVRSPDAAS